uniref:C2H2-type domain-containing protein n=1 Tax=Anopheles farauti TaxID=69004 RepID=A0A182Q6Y6_9DIPT
MEQLIRADMQAIQAEAPVAAPAMILTSAQLINAGTQIINTGHIITTATGQQIIQTTPQFQAATIGQFIQGPNNTANCKKQPECEICHKSFRGPGMLRMHMKTHEVNKIPTCSICNKEFKSKSILYRHRQTHFEKTFECSMCDKKFSSNYQLNVHEHRHKLQKNHKCPHCDKAFVFDSELKNHIQHHLGSTVAKNKKKSTSRS